MLSNLFPCNKCCLTFVDAKMDPQIDHKYIYLEVIPGHKVLPTKANFDQKFKTQISAATFELSQRNFQDHLAWCLGSCGAQKVEITLTSYTYKSDVF